MGIVDSRRGRLSAQCTDCNECEDEVAEQPSLHNHRSVKYRVSIRAQVCKSVRLLWHMASDCCR